MRFARRAVPAAALLMALTGCGGDDPEPATGSLTVDEQAAADNLAAQIVRSSEMSGQAPDAAVTKAQAGCIAEGAVGEVGLESLQEYGIVTEDLLVNKSIQGVEMDAADADALAGVFIDCIDAEMLFEQRFLDELGVNGSEEAVRSCVEKAVGADAVRKVLAASFEGRRTPAYQKLQQRVSACGRGADPGQ